MFNIGKARAEIEERNRVRAEAQLPLLSVPQELRNLYELSAKQNLKNFFEHLLFGNVLSKRCSTGCGDCAETRNGSQLGWTVGFFSIRGQAE